MRLYPPQPRRLSALRIAGWALWPLAVAVAAFPWSGAVADNAAIPASETLRSAVQILSVLLALVLAGGGAGALIVAQRYARGAVMADHEGVWPTALARGDGLVAWQAVARLRRHWLDGRLELLGADGAVLLAIDRHLDGFERLRELVSRKVPVGGDGNSP